MTDNLFYYVSIKIVINTLTVIRDVKYKQYNINRHLKSEFMWDEVVMQLFYIIFSTLVSHI